jgi:hypothetical protein
LSMLMAHRRHRWSGAFRHTEIISGFINFPPVPWHWPAV